MIEIQFNKKIFTKEEVDAFNRYTHFPIDINEDYNNNVFNILNDVKEKLKKKGIEKIPIELEDAINNYKTKLKTWYLTKSEINSYAPPIYVVGPAKYPIQKLKIANQREEKNNIMLENAVENIYKTLRNIIKYELDIDIINKWKDVIDNVSKVVKMK